MTAQDESIKESKSQQCPHRFERVLEFDLFAFGVISRIESDRHFEDAVFAFENLGGEFMLEVKSF